MLKVCHSHLKNSAQLVRMLKSIVHRPLGTWLQVLINCHACNLFSGSFLIDTPNLHVWKEELKTFVVITSFYSFEMYRLCAYFCTYEVGCYMCKRHPETGTLSHQSQ
jgi:hypothetical protein